MKQYIASTEIADKQPFCNIQKQVASSIIVMKKVRMLPVPYGFGVEEYGYSTYCAYGFYDKEYREC